jgi:predicted transposase YbfD/YdcC
LSANFFYGRQLFGKSKKKSAISFSAEIVMLKALEELYDCIGGIENSLHWVLDMAFRENECRIPCPNQNMVKMRLECLHLYGEHSECL